MSLLKIAPQEEQRSLKPSGVVMSERLSMRLLSYVNLYCNTRCNSRCVTCSFWRQDQLLQLSPGEVQSVIKSSYVDDSTWFALQGGEFSLHPRADEILELLKGKNYILFSNLLAPDKVFELVRRHEVPYITVSLDGGPDGYRRIRGVDGFARVTSALLRLRELANVFVGITLTPWSELRDYEEAAHFCRKHGIEFGVSLYTDSHIYEADGPIQSYPFLDRVASDADSPFCAAYESWRIGKLSLPCHSIREVASVTPDGAVYLCHNQKISLGSLREKSFDEIWGFEATRKLHEQYASCNECWTSCYREFDHQRALSGEDQLIRSASEIDA
jgi:MoaA/NifB/PqqE/SkfB family radical SAM enzyme